MKISLLVLLLFVGLSCLASAHRPIFSDRKATGPDSAIHIEEPDVSQVVYREISAEAPSLWLDADLAETSELYVQIGVPRIERLARFRPAVAILGPGLPSIALPFELPEGAGGILLKTDDVEKPQEFHEPFTGTDSWILRSKTQPLTDAGKYYIVAFDPKKEFGKLWLAVGRRESFGVGDLLKFGGWKAETGILLSIYLRSGNFRAPITVPRIRSPQPASSINISLV